MKGETDILLSDTVREGYKFLGWYTSPTFEEDTRVTMITKDEPDELVLYANGKRKKKTSLLTLIQVLCFILLWE